MKLLNANISSNKTELLAKTYAKLINSGVNSEKILVLLQSPTKKENFLKIAKKLIDVNATGKLNVYTFFGLCYNFVNDNWILIENSIKDEKAFIEPNLCGLEVTQRIFKDIINEIDFTGYNSRKNLLHQLLRRYSLICQNALSKDEIDKRTKILKESFSLEVQNSINSYRLKTLNLRALDYLRQLEAFSFVYKNVENPFEFVIVDDADEITPACFEYLKFISANVKEFFIAQDFLGSSREGYLSASKIDFKCFLNVEPENLPSQNKSCDEIFENIKNGMPVNLKNIDVSTFVKRNEMLDFTVNTINMFLKDGVKPNEIAVVAPNLDFVTKFILNKKLHKNTFLLSGSEKLTQNPFVYGVLTLLKVINGLEADPYSTRGAFLKILNIKLNDTILPNKIFSSNSKEFQAFLELAKKVKDLKISAQFFEICTNFIELNLENRDGINKLNAFHKQICDFEAVFGVDYAKNYVLKQIENTIISENPIFSEAIDTNSIIVATPQKIIDSGIKTKYQFWLDISSNSWLKQDIGPLYNAWVFQKNWNKEDFTLQDNLDLTLDKTARVLRKLYLSNDEAGKIFAISSFYDFSLNENFGGISKFFETQEDVSKNSNNFNITPRDDQKPVLDYKGGKMAVSAVAGSGKTTIMLALILKLLQSSVKAENIFVLTFMDSAARNFKERIKASFPNLKELPHISTIHGLALRILRENNNYSKLNIDEDFEIIDEIRKHAILCEIMFSMEIDPKKADLYGNAISTLKNRIKFNIDSPLLKRIFTLYQAYLRENNLLDYDDLLSFSLKLLSENDDVRAYYQDLAHFVIEDEAQDSSFVQQELIRLLGGKFNNIIRCGDVNQSITATFTNSDVEGFKKFIKDNTSVNMNCSERCAKRIYGLANDLLDYADKNNVDAFLNVKMCEVVGKNPKNPKELVPLLFENQFSERNFILKKIKEILKNDKSASIGILLRSNRAVDDWAYFINSNAIKAKTRRDTLELNPIYKTILAIFDFLENPVNANVVKCFHVLNDFGYYKNDFGIEKIQEPFIEGDFSEFEIWWDLREFLLSSYKNPADLALSIADYYFSSSNQAINIAPISFLVAKIFQQEKSFDKMLKKMHDISARPNFAGAKLFEVEDENKAAVNIMTYHKSKGDEFDYVFLPELFEDNILLNPQKVKLRDDTMFLEGLKANPKTKEGLKDEIVKENFRILYVAITRARKCLFISCAYEYKIFSRVTKKAVSPIFPELLKVEVKNAQ